MQVVQGMEVFVRVAELRSFTRAAQALGLTPSGVGKLVSRLEAELGVRLLHRTTRHVGLTDEGAVFLDHCRRVLEDIDRAVTSVSGRGEDPRGRLRVSLPLALGKLVVLPALGAFYAAHPDIALGLSLSDRRVNLVEEGFDLAVRVGPLNDSSLVARRVGVSPVVTVAAPSLLARMPVESLGDLALAPCVAYLRAATGRERPWTFRVDGRSVPWPTRASVVIDDGEAMVAAARAGIGVTQLPIYMVREGLEDGSLVEVLAALRPPPEPVHVVYPSQRNLPARTRAFLDFIAGLDGWARASRRPAAGA